MKYIKTRLKSDDGGGITVLYLWSFVFFMIIAIFLVDLSRGIYLRNAYTGAAQRATQTALKEQNSIGGLTPKAAEKVVDEYMIQRNGEGSLVHTDKSGKRTNVIDKGSSASRVGCQKQHPEYPKVSVEFSDKRNNSVANGNTSGFASRFEYKNGQYNPPLDRNYPEFYQRQYRTIRVVVEDVGDNYFWGMFGKPCSFYIIETSAISIDADAGDTGI